MIGRTCLNCSAVFEGEDTLERLIKHQENCTKKQPYLDDETADFYEEEILD